MHDEFWCHSLFAFCTGGRLGVSMGIGPHQVAKDMIGQSGRLLREKLQQHFEKVCPHAFSVMCLRRSVATVDSDTLGPNSGWNKTIQVGSTKSEANKSHDRWKDRPPTHNCRSYICTWWCSDVVGSALVYTYTIIYTYLHMLTRIHVCVLRYRHVWIRLD